MAALNVSLETTYKQIRRLDLAVIVEKMIFMGLVGVALLLAFYNLENNPAPWHDEGAVMSLARTLAEDGVYAVRNSDGYQTFGPVQSVGPTVVLPLALSFKLFGPGLLQGRLVGALFMLFTLAVFYRLGRELFGTGTALLAVALLLWAPSVGLVYWGRQALGLVPAVGFFLAGWLVYLHTVQREGSHRFEMLTGLLLGAAIVTKMQYLVTGLGTLVLLAGLDLVYYRQRQANRLTRIGLTTLICVAAWWGWQWLYFGPATFQENAAKLQQLSNATSGFDPRLSLQAFKFLIGPDSGHFYFYWGLPALLYGGILSLRRTQESLNTAFLWIFILVWLTLYMFWLNPSPQYLFAPALVTALFVAKLWRDLIGGFHVSIQTLRMEIIQGRPATNGLKAVVILALALTIGYELQRFVRFHMFVDKANDQVQTASLLEAIVPEDAIIETWERELAILTGHRYHFPDQSLLILTHAVKRRVGLYNYSLGGDYFQKHQPDYLVIGPFAEYFGGEVYASNFLAQNGELLATIGENKPQYKIYEIHLPSSSASAEAGRLH